MKMTKTLRTGGTEWPFICLDYFFSCIPIFLTKSARTTDNGHGSALRVTLLPLTLTSHLIINPLDPNRVVLLTRWAISKLAIKNKITNKEREERVSLQNYNFFSLLVSRNTKNWTQKSYQELPRVLSCSKVFSAHCSKMTVRGTMVRSEVCNSWCFCLES